MFSVFLCTINMIVMTMWVLSFICTIISKCIASVLFLRNFFGARRSFVAFYYNDFNTFWINVKNILDFFHKFLTVFKHCMFSVGISFLISFDNVRKYLFSVNSNEHVNQSQTKILTQKIFIKYWSTTKYQY